MEFISIFCFSSNTNRDERVCKPFIIRIRRYILHLHIIIKHCWIIYNTTGIKCTMGCISPLKVRVHFSPVSMSTRYSRLSVNYDRSFVFCTTNKTDCNNITEILLKVALNTQPRYCCVQHMDVLFDPPLCAFFLSLYYFFVFLSTCIYASLLYFISQLCFK